VRVKMRKSDKFICQFLGYSQTVHISSGWPMNGRPISAHDCTTVCKHRPIRKFTTFNRGGGSLPIKIIKLQTASNVYAMYNLLSEYTACCFFFVAYHSVLID